jgi:hypothetical protein
MANKQTEPQAPSWRELFDLLMESGGDNRAFSNDWLEPFAHALLARWGNHAVNTPLDQPEPEEEEWYSRFADWLEREMPEGTVIGDPLWWASKIADYLARAYLAQPEPEGPTDEELQTLLYYEFTTSTGHGERSDPIGFARAVLARWGRPSIEPVPVSERLPTEADCDAERMCWWWHPDHKEDEFTDGWMLLKPEWAGGHHDTDDSPSYTHWLPHWAMPIPTQHS